MMQQVLTRKNVILAVALLLTFWLSWQTYQQEVESTQNSAVQAVIRSEPANGFNKSSARTLAKTDRLDVEPLTINERHKATQPFFNLFAIPVKHIDRVAVSVEEPVAPIAPKLPFKYMGVVTEMDQTRVILDYQGEVLAVKSGDSLGVNYKLLSINKTATSKELVFAYMPMNITQTMVVNDVLER